MSSFARPLCSLFVSSAMGLLMFALVPVSANAQMGKGTNFCKKLYNPNLNASGKVFASQGAQMYCFGAPQRFARTHLSTPASSATATIRNVDAANPSEDISPNSTQLYGQAETSIAAADQYVVEAWNDATGFLSPCPSPKNKEELTGFGFSRNGGYSFTDLGGLPNSQCTTGLYEGDPSVETWKFQGQHYFYISSLFATTSGGGSLEIAVTACQVIGYGSSANLHCGQPTVVATSPTGTMKFSSLDKDFETIDPVRGRLYISYTDFANPVATSTIALAACDLTKNPMHPVCSNGSTNGPIYLVVAPPDPNGCEKEGAYPAVDLTTGDVYVAYEHNWPSAFATGPCQRDPAREVVTRIPASCLKLPGPSACTGPFTHTAQLVVSLSDASIPGYNRFPMNDFPRIAVSSVHGTVSIVWNDGRYKPSGDILLQSWFTGNSFPARIQSKPLVVDHASTAGHGWQFLPGMRNTDDDGNLYICWYGRSSPNTAITSVFEAAGVNPRASATPSNIRITNVASDWNAVSSDIVPNFGDYTDNYVGATGNSGPPFTGEIDYTAWSDGRLGDPQPFEAHITH
jgi:hypothetical protein